MDDERQREVIDKQERKSGMNPIELDYSQRHQYEFTFI